MKKNILSLLIFFTLVTPVFAGTQTGVISTLNLNANVDGRGLCIQMTPDIETGSSWACLFDPSSHLYKEITSVLLAAYTAKLTCRVDWGIENNGKGEINLVECK